MTALFTALYPARIAQAVNDIISVLTVIFTLNISNSAPLGVTPVLTKLAFEPIKNIIEIKRTAFISNIKIYNWQLGLYLYPITILKIPQSIYCNRELPL